MSLPRFGVTRPVPVNLLMLAMLLGGVVAGLSLRREFFPEIEPEAAMVTMPYPGATPEEIEETLAIKVEDKLIDLDEVDELRTTVSEGGGGIVVTFREGLGNVQKAVDEVERAVDSLIDLPEESERMTVTEMEPRLPAIMVTVYGDANEETLKRAIRTVRDDLKSLPGMGEVVISGVRDYEIRVDVETEALFEHGVSLPKIADRIKSWMADVPGGVVRSSVSNVNVRTLGVQERASAIGDIVIKADRKGQSLRVRDIATVRETFVDEQIMTRFNGQPSASLTVYKLGAQDIVLMAEMARAYVAGRSGESIEYEFVDRLNPVVTKLAELGDREPPEMISNQKRAYDLGRSSIHALPPSVKIATQSDLARFVEGRLALLLENAIYGSILVFGTLLIFLNWRGALWVGVGLITAMAGTLVLMWWLDITLNLLTMFGLIVVIGLLVDDAIVVAENIQARHDRGESSLVAAVKGANQVSWPVVATVLTSIVAFLPLTFIKGSIGDLLGALPTVVAVALLMSLLESLLILPSHLGHSLVKRDRKTELSRWSLWIRRLEKRRDAFIFDRVVPTYVRFLRWSLNYRYITLALATAAVMISFGLVKGGIVGFTFLPSEDAETVVIEMRMPVGTSIETTDNAASRIERAAGSQPEVKTISTVVGSISNLETGTAESSASNSAQIFLELYEVEARDRSSQEVIQSIRESLRGRIDDIDRMVFTEISGGPGGRDITVQIRGDDEQAMFELVDEVKVALAQFAGVFDIADDSTRGQRELQVRLNPSAAALGFSVSDVARQVRGALYGLDAHVFSDRQEDIDVRVRLNEDTRHSLQSIETLWLISPSGQRVPLAEVAELVDGQSYATIKRIDRKRAISVTADTSPEISPEDITPELPIEQWRADYPMLDIAFAGRQEQQADAFESLPLGFGAALIMIYVILAWLFSNYLQPLAVMLGIPFSLIGVIWGHMLLGFDLTFLSMIGFVALSGIVVNDSLILVKFYNERRQEGLGLREALVDAGRARLRPIFLTTITTILGLTPLMMEQSFQARFLIPMAIAISFGLMSATVLILMLLPCLLVIIDDLKKLTYLLWTGRHRPKQDLPTESVPDILVD